MSDMRWHEMTAGEIQAEFNKLKSSRDRWRKVAIDAYEYGYMYKDSAEIRAQADYEGTANDC